MRLTASDLVVDVDPRNIDGGQKGMLPALKAIGLNPDHFPTVLTGGGGLHLYMTKPSHLSIVDGLPDVPGIEFKTFGRQVVAPGSVHPSGKPYSWSSVPDDLWLGAPKAPEKLLRLIRRTQTTCCPVWARHWGTSTRRNCSNLGQTGPRRFS